MAELVCLRSLWQTLIAAASTYVLFVAANWGNAYFFHASASQLADQYFFHAYFVNHAFGAYGTPLFPLFISLKNALKVRTVKAWLGRINYEAGILMRDHGSIAIITLCPIFIQIPGGTVTVIPAWLQSCERVTMSRDAFQHRVCPLELHPDTEASTVIYVTQNSDEWVCLQILSIELRSSLLSSGLAPKHEQLSFIRARNKFQTVVTLLQAGGCVLSVLQRLVQHLGISPVEAIATFLSILVALQLLVELYACGNYQRPLLLRLDAQQLELFRVAPVLMPDTKRSIARMFVSFLLWVLVSVPAFYYFLHYVHTHFISSLSSFLFFLSQMLVGSNFVDTRGFKIVRRVFSLCSVLLFGCSMVVAVVGTIVEWSAFHHPTLHNWFAWILPHVT